jgi:hypothetical protein
MFAEISSVIETKIGLVSAKGRVAPFLARN